MNTTCVLCTVFAIVFTKELAALLQTPCLDLGMVILKKEQGKGEYHLGFSPKLKILAISL